MYFRVPRFDDLQTQRNAQYQMELGVYEPNEVESFEPKAHFNWQIDRKLGSELMVRKQDTGIPIAVKRARVVGQEVVVAYATSKPGADRSGSYSRYRIDQHRTSG